MDTDRSALATMADGLAGTFSSCEDAPLALALLRELAKGEPVGAPALRNAGVGGGDELPAALSRWPNVHVDEHGRVVAFGGLSLARTAHGFAVGGRQLYTWCAWDTLFLPALLGQPARVESSCPETGSDVRLVVDRSGVQQAEPEALWVSFPAPAATSTTDITGSFCCHVHFLAGRSAAVRWLSGHAGATVLTLRDAFELGRMATRCLADET
jgi:alkylmercury lyase